MIVFAGLGISKDDIPLKVIEIARDMDEIYVEFYTSLIPNSTKEYLENLLKKKIEVLERSGLEEKSDEILNKAKDKKIMILVPGDPMVFTTHHSIWLEAKRMKVKTEIIHATSVYSAAISSSGLQVSKFGRSVTLPLRFNKEEYDSICENIIENKNRGLHTLVLMEITKDDYLLIGDAIKRLKDVIDGKIIVLARIGSKNQIIKYDNAMNLSKKDFGKPPFAIMIPGKLHFAEKEFLESLE